MPFVQPERDHQPGRQRREEPNELDPRAKQQFSSNHRQIQAATRRASQ